jgi:aminopeptidase N
MTIAFGGWMNSDSPRLRQKLTRLARFARAAALLVGLTAFSVARADEPTAPALEYHLENARIELRFDVDQRKVIGQVTHALAALNEGLKQLDFDSVDLTIQSVTVNGKVAHFSTDSGKLHVDLDRPAKSREKYEVVIRYEGKPKKGLYFILPNKSNPTRPIEIWTQGEAEDTRYYLPIHDYPNDRTTTEMILTVPESWQTVSNGRLVSVVNAGQGIKTWTWRQALPVSTYLISVVAGEFDKQSDSWHNIPVDYVVPHGEADRIAPTFQHTRDMLTFYSDRFGVPYPWVKYDQTMVDQFTESGMENVSATTLTTRDLLHPALAKESMEGADPLTSHELGHQWFGDLVTCNDWSNLWLNEGFATFLAQLWEEHEYGADNAAYARWRGQAAWRRQTRLYTVPIVNTDFKNSMDFAGNIYGKAGLVLEMLREQMGDYEFFHGLQHYLEANRLKTVVTADLVKALDDSNGTKVDDFFSQWIYGGGAPQFTVDSSYDAEAQKLNLTVMQTQKTGGHVGLFHVPVEVAISTASGTKSFPITVSKQEETFSFPADSKPLSVLFDKGDKILKTVDFHKTTAQWIYQLQNAQDVPDRADAAQALGAIKGDAAVVAALGDAALHDRFWGVRNESLLALGRIGGSEAEQRILAATVNSDPWVRETAVSQLGQFRDDATLAAKLAEVSRSDAAYRIRSAALIAYGQLKPSGGLAFLQEAARMESPDDTIRRAALRAMGALGDDMAVETLRTWSEQGKPIDVRGAAIASLAQLDKKNEAVESQLIAYLDDPETDISVSASLALGGRGDPAAIAPLQAMLNRSDVSPDLARFIQRALAQLKRDGSGDGRPSARAVPSHSAVSRDKAA